MISKILDKFINYDVIKINKHSIKEVVCHGQFHSHAQASARRSMLDLPASNNNNSYFYKKLILILKIV